MRNEVIETWNGIQCPWCVVSDQQIQTIIYTSGTGRIAAINFHAGFFAEPQSGQPDFTTPQGDIHHEEYNPGSYPASMLNRRHFGVSQVFNYFDSNDSQLEDFLVEKIIIE